MSEGIDQLIYESRVFYHSLVRIGEEIHAESGLSLSMRAVLEYLVKFGPSSVPNIARSRRVSRQRIQTQVNELAERSFVETQTNPASKRSHLIALRPEGLKMISAMKTKEAKIISQVNISDAKCRDAKQVLRDLRAGLEGNVFKQEPIESD